MRAICPIHSQELKFNGAQVKLSVRAKPIAVASASIRPAVPFIYIKSEGSKLCALCIADGHYGEQVCEEAKLTYPDHFRPGFLEAANAY